MFLQDDEDEQLLYHDGTGVSLLAQRCHAVDSYPSSPEGGKVQNWVAENFFCKPSMYVVFVCGLFFNSLCDNVAYDSCRDSAVFIQKIKSVIR